MLWAIGNKPSELTEEVMVEAEGPRASDNFFLGAGELGATESVGRENI